jgi:hypothetical protein
MGCSPAFESHKSKKGANAGDAAVQFDENFKQIRLAF